MVIGNIVFVEFVDLERVPVEVTVFPFSYIYIFFVLFQPLPAGSRHRPE